MWRRVIRLTPNIAIPIFGKGNQYDNDIINQPTQIEPQTGWDRVKRMYRGNEHEEVSVELNTVMQASLSGAFIGACLGGFVQSRVAYMNFIENNQATIFKSTADAKKKLQDYVTVAFAKGACRWGWRLCIFTGVFSLIATTVSVYRNDTSLIEFISAGAITGALFKINMGIPAILVGAGLGTVLSAISGIIILGVLKITGLSMEQIRNALYTVDAARDAQYNSALEKSATIKNDEFTHHHNLLLNEKGERKLEELPDKEDGTGNKQ